MTLNKVIIDHFIIHVMSLLESFEFILPYFVMLSYIKLQKCKIGEVQRSWEFKSWFELVGKLVLDV